MNQTGDSTEAQEQAQKTKWNQRYDAIKDDERGDRSSEKQAEASTKRLKLFEFSTPEQKAQLINDAVQSFGNKEGVEISAVIRKAFGFIPEDPSDIQDVIDGIIDGKKIVGDSEGPSGGDYILE